MAISLDQLFAANKASIERRKAQHIQDTNIITELIDDYYDDGANDWERQFLKGNLSYLETGDDKVLSAKVRDIAMTMEDTIKARLEKPL